MAPDKIGGEVATDPTANGVSNNLTSKTDGTESIEVGTLFESVMEQEKRNDTGSTSRSWYEKELSESERNTIDLGVSSILHNGYLLAARRSFENSKREAEHIKRKRKESNKKRNRDGQGSDQYAHYGVGGRYSPDSSRDLYDERYDEMDRYRRRKDEKSHEVNYQRCIGGTEFRRREFWYDHNNRIPLTASSSSRSRSRRSEDYGANQYRSENEYGVVSRSHDRDMQGQDAREKSRRHTDDNFESSGSDSGGRRRRRRSRNDDDSRSSRRSFCANGGIEHEKSSSPHNDKSCNNGIPYPSKGRGERERTSESGKGTYSGRRRSGGDSKSRHRDEHEQDGSRRGDRSSDNNSVSDLSGHRISKRQDRDRRRRRKQRRQERGGSPLNESDRKPRKRSRRRRRSTSDTSSLQGTNGAKDS